MSLWVLGANSVGIPLLLTRSGIGAEPMAVCSHCSLCLPDGPAAAARGLIHALRQTGNNSRKSAALPCTCERSDGLSALPGRHIRSFSCWRLNSSSSQLFPLISAYLVPHAVQGGGRMENQPFRLAFKNNPQSLPGGNGPLLPAEVWSRVQARDTPNVSSPRLYILKGV